MNETKEFYFKSIQDFKELWKKTNVSNRYIFALDKLLTLVYDECTSDIEVLAIQEYFDHILKNVEIKNNLAYIEGELICGAISYIEMFKKLPHFEEAGKRLNIRIENGLLELPKRVLEPQGEWKPLFNTCSVCNTNHRWIDTGFCEDCKVTTSNSNNPL